MASVSLILNKPYYLAGEQIQGTAFANIPFPTRCDAFVVKFTGYERTLIQETHQEPYTETHHHHGRLETRTCYRPVTITHKDGREFFKQKVILFSCSGTVFPAGQYQFPFVFQLPPGLPGVFCEERIHFGDKLKAAIVYKVKVLLDISNTKADIKQSYKICVAEACWTQPTPVVAKNEKGFLFASGKLKMEASIPKNIFCPLEHVPVHLHVKNESSKDVAAFKVKLMRDLTVRAKHATRTFTEEMSRQVWDGVKEKNEKIVDLPYQIPNAIPSTASGCIECRYHLDIECDVKMAFDLEVHVPITVALLPSSGQPINLYQNYSKGWN